MTTQLDIDDVASLSPLAMMQLSELRRDSKMLDWLAERLEDVEIDGVDPCSHFRYEDSDNEMLWPTLWRRAIAERIT